MHGITHWQHVRKGITLILADLEGRALSHLQTEPCVCGTCNSFVSPYTCTGVRVSDFVHMPSALTVSLIDLCEDLSFMTLKCLRKKNKFMSAVMVRAGKHRKHTPNLYAHTDIMVVRVFVNQICLAAPVAASRAPWWRRFSSSFERCYRTGGKVVREAVRESCPRSRSSSHSASLSSTLESLSI